MSPKISSGHEPQSDTVRRVLRAMLALGALLLVAFVLTRGNPNAGIFLFLAVVCAGLALVFLLAGDGRGLSGTILERTGGSERDLFIGGLLLIALLTPWSVAVPTLHWRQTLGWQSLIPLLIVVALVLVRLRRLGRYRMVAILLASLGLAAWFGWLGAQLLTPRFSTTGFPFLPIDLVGEGWYLALLALAISVDGLATEAADDDRPARSSQTWPFAIVPGMALVRLHYPGRGRLYLVAAALTVFLVQANAIEPQEFQYYGSLGGLPQPYPRGGVVIPIALGLLVWLASLLDTQRKLRLERSAGVVARPYDRRNSTAV
jgi:hypothetical protein